MHLADLRCAVVRIFVSGFDMMYRLTNLAQPDITQTLPLPEVRCNESLDVNIDVNEVLQNEHTVKGVLEALQNADVDYLYAPGQLQVALK